LDRLLRDDYGLTQARRVAESMSADDGAAHAARIVLDMLEHLRRK
jgi:UDP:flavonoid glycosyltransferase YjiC (YdhE family)